MTPTLIGLALLAILFVTSTWLLSRHTTFVCPVCGKFQGTLNPDKPITPYPCKSCLKERS